MSIKSRIVTLIVLSLSISFSAAFATEWTNVYAEDDPDAIELEPFEVDGSDPDTFDWEGYAAYWQSIEETFLVLEDAFDDDPDSPPPSDDPDPEPVAINSKNGKCLTNEGSKNFGWVESDGNGGHKIGLNVNNEIAKTLRDAGQSRMADLFNDSIKEHETNHVTKALEVNPEIFDTDQAGLFLANIGPEIREGAGISENKIVSEMAAYEAQSLYLESIISDGAYGGETLSSEELEIAAGINRYVESLKSDYEEKLNP